MRATLLCLSLSLALPSCALFGLGEPEEVWVEKEVREAPFEDLWEVAKQAFAHARYAVKEQDTVSGQLVSSWRFELNPYSREEKRYRATMQLQRKGGGVVLLRARVEKQGNDKMEATMDPERGDWKPEGDDEDQARFLIQYLLLKTKSFGPSDEFYRKERWKRPGD